MTDFAPDSPDRPDPLVERATEVAAITALLDAAAVGSGGTALIRGIGGIGKSTLLQRAADEAADRGWLVLRAAGDELEQEFSFGVALQLFEPLLNKRSGAEVDELFDGPAGLARPLLTSHGERLPDESGIFSTLHGLSWLVADLAAERPIVVLVDDAQWADLASLRFLAYLAKRIDDQRVALLVATRPMPAGQRASVVSGIAERRLVEPRPLTPQGFARVVRSADHDLAIDDQDLDRWYGLTGGVPLFIEELLRSDHAFRDSDVGVDHHLATVRTRLGKLSPPARRLVEAAAVAGEGTPWWQSSAIGGVDDRGGEIHRELVEAALLGDAPTVRFVHPVIREAIEESLAPADAARLHADMAALLIDTVAPVEIVAHHLMSSPPSGSERHAEILERAAVRARASGSTGHAVQWLQRALDERPSPAQRVRMLGELAVCRASEGDERWRADLDAYLADTPDPEARAHVRLRIGRSLSNRGRLSEATDVLRTAIDETDADLGDLLLELLAALAVTSRIDVDRRLELDEEVAAAMERADLETSPAARALMSHLAYDRALACVPAAEVSAMARRSILHDQLQDDEVVGSGAFYQALLAFHFTDDSEGAELGVQRGLLAAQRLGNEPLYGALHNVRGFSRMAEGRIDEAIDELTNAVEIIRRTRGLTLPGTFGNLALATAIGGDLEGAHRALQLPSGNDRWQATASFSHYLFTRGCVRLASGDATGADDLRTVIDRQQRLGAENPATIPAAFALAEHLAASAPTEAADLWARAFALAEQFGAPRTLAIGLRVGALVEPTSALDRLEQAESLLAETPWGLERMRVRLALGAARAAAGRADAAKEPLRAALSEADAGGALSLAEQAQALLLATGARPRRRALTGPASLTPTERHVAALAADGQSNREIAARRFVSVKAVEFQLANAYRKLGIRSRAELAAALADQPDPT